MNKNFKTLVFNTVKFSSKTKFEKMWRLFNEQQLKPLNVKHRNYEMLKTCLVEQNDCNETVLNKFLNFVVAYTFP